MRYFNLGAYPDGSLAVERGFGSPASWNEVQEHCLKMLHGRWGTSYVKVELGPGRLAEQDRRQFGTLGLTPSADYFCDIYHDLEYGLPFPANSINEYFSSQTIEHVRDTINLFNELYRTLKPNGFMVHRVPLFPTPYSVADPTHKAFFVPESFQYYSIRPDGTRFVESFSDYGITAAFVIEECRVVNGIEIVVRMRKPA